MKTYYWILVIGLGLVIAYLSIRLVKIQNLHTDKTEIITKTDTITRYEPIKELKPFRTPVLPKTEIQYKIVRIRDLEEINKLKLRIKEDSILISGLEDSLAIHKNYIKIFPDYPKLLALDLQKSNLSLSLLHIDGIPREYQYPINLDRYRYRWTEHSFTSDFNVIIPRKRKYNYYLGSGIDIGNKLLYSSFRVERIWARSRLYLHTQIGLFTDNYSGVKIGYEYNLRKQ